MDLPVLLEHSPLSPLEVLNVLLHREEAVLVIVAQFIYDVFEVIQSVPTLVISSEEEWMTLPDPIRCQFE